MRLTYRRDELESLVNNSRPMLMLDRALVDQGEKTAEGVKAVSVNEDFFVGHFPGNPIMPGVMQIAAMVQLGSALCRSLYPALKDHSWQPVRIERVKFRKLVVPGDLLVVTAGIKGEEEGGGIVVTAETITDGQKACQGIIVLRPFNPQELVTEENDRMTVPFRHFEGVELDPENFFSVNEIAAVVPHRYPFLLLDRVLFVDHDAPRVLALKNTTGNEPFFAGLDVPVVPLYLLAEMAAQAGCFLALREPVNEGKIGYFMAIDRASFIEPVNLGDQILFDSRMYGKGRFGKGESDLYVGDNKVAEIAIKFAMVEPSSEG